MGAGPSERSELSGGDEMKDKLAGAGMDGRAGDTSRIGCLDGLRGLASLWVLVGHGLLLSG